MSTKAERGIEKKEGLAGGTGPVELDHLISKEQMGRAGRMFAQVTLKPGSSVGYHEHHGESETYYLLSGEGAYQDNGREYPVTAGDVTFCDDGSAHGLKNTGDKDLTFIALIINK